MTTEKTSPAAEQRSELERAIAYIGLKLWARSYKDSLPADVFVPANADTWSLNFKGHGASSRYPKDYLAPAVAFVQSWMGEAATLIASKTGGSREHGWIIASHAEDGDPYTMDRFALVALPLARAARMAPGDNELMTCRRLSCLPFSTSDQVWVDELAADIRSILLMHTPVVTRSS